MSQITIDLVDKKHIVARGRVFKNRAENWHFYREEDARAFLKDLLKHYGAYGYTVEIVAKDAFVLTKATSTLKKPKAKKAKATK